MRHNFYVDDGLTSTDDVHQARELIKNTKALCRDKGLRLHKFISNEQGALKDVPVEDCAATAQALDLHNAKEKVERTLGIEWCINTDVFKFTM